MIYCSLRSIFLQTADHYAQQQQPNDSRRRCPLVMLALKFRLLIWLAMCWSCLFFPSIAHHNPGGDDVVRFELFPPHEQTNTAAAAAACPPHAPRTRTVPGTYCFDYCQHANDCVWPQRHNEGGDAAEEATAPLEQQQQDYSSSTSSSFLQTKLYPFLLQPLTRWDAARFLRLALQPQLRTPRRRRRRRRRRLDDHDDDAICYNDSDDDTTCPNSAAAAAAAVMAPRVENDDDDDDEESEMAHAFFPVVPYMIQLTARLLLLWTTLLIPPSCSLFLLPCTCQGVLVLAALIFNTICFCIAVSSLYIMTLQVVLLSHHATTTTTTTTSITVEAHHHTISENDDSDIDDSIIGHKWATRVTLLFICNPASVFFTSAYSESFFCACTFTGSCLLLLLLSLPRRKRINNNSNNNNITTNGESAGGALLHFMSMSLAVTCWTLAIGARSNGIVHVGFVILYGMGRFLLQPPSPKPSSLQRHQQQVPDTNVQRDNMSSDVLWFWLQRVVEFKAYLLLAGVLFIPLIWHNRRGIALHCPPDYSNDNDMDTAPTMTRPLPTAASWCPQTGESSSFHLYSYVQKKYWNVGFMRYYRAKQIPNFILAAPILMLSFYGTAMWIQTNMIYYSSLRNDADKTNSNSKNTSTTTSIDNDKQKCSTTAIVRNVIGAIVSLAVCALRDFSHGGMTTPAESIEDHRHEKSTSHDNQHTAAATTTTFTTARTISPTPVNNGNHSTSSISSSYYNYLNHPLLGPACLGHYAVLAATAFLGLTVAHVQISTRMICSTCPALYWFMAVLISADDDDGDTDDSTSTSATADKLFTTAKNSSSTNQNRHRRLHLGNVILWYCLLYNILGVILHPNWLPWT